MKAANEKKNRVNETMESTPKLCAYFASKSNVPSTSEVMSTSETITSTTVIVADSANQQRDNSRHHLIVEGAYTDTFLTFLYVNILNKSVIYNCLCLKELSRTVRL